MILKGNARADGDDLASHLMNAYDNDLTELADLRGTVAKDLHGAFAEFEALALGTRCQKSLYSLSINPSVPMTKEQYRTAVEKIEEGLGLTGLPRAVVFHIKDGREHCHVVWSRIDAAKMRAAQLSHDRMKLRTLARDLGREFGHELPEGLATDRGGQRFEQGKLSVTFADMAQADRSGISPDSRRAAITAAFRGSDTGKAFIEGLKERGYVLARGDKRGFVVVDSAGHVHSLARQVTGAKTRDIRAKLAPLQPEDLPPVAEVKKEIEQAQERLSLEETHRPGLRRPPEELKARQAKRRAALMAERQALAVKHQAERMKLHAAQKAEKDRPFARAVQAVWGLFTRLPVLRSVLGHIRKNPKLSLAERHKLENEALDRRYAREKADMDRRAKALDRVEARENRSLGRDRRRMERAKANEQVQSRKQWKEAYEANLRDVTLSAGKATPRNRQDRTAPDRPRTFKANRPKDFGFER